MCNCHFEVYITLGLQFKNYIRNLPM